MLRVAILGNYRPTLETQAMRGGAQSASAYLINALQAFPDLEIHVVVSTAKSRGDGVEQVGDLTVHSLPSSGRWQLISGFRGVKKDLGDRLEKIQPDVIHAQDLTMGAIACSMARDKTLLTVHGILREEARYYDRRSERVRALMRARWIENECFQNIKNVIAISPYVHRYYPTFAKLNVYDIPNAIDESFFDIDEPRDGKRLLYAGRLIPRKRIADLIRVVDLVRQRHSDVRLHIAGDLSDREYVRELRSTVARLGLGEHVRFLGQLDEAAIKNEFRECQALVLASAQETSPMVIAQAMAAGKVVIATPAGGVPDMITHRSTGMIVPVGDIQGFADCILEVLESDDLASQLGRAARAKAQAEYRASAVAERTRRAYYDIHSANGNGRQHNAIHAAEEMSGVAR